VGRKYTDNAKTTLAGGISGVATTLTVAAGKGDLFPQVTGAGTPGSTPNFFVIKLKNAAGTIEKMRVEHRAAASDVLGSAGFPLVRGYDGTVAQAWNAGDFVSLTVERSAVQGWEDGFNAGALGRAFGYKDSTTAGLNFGYYGGVVAAGTIADGTVALTASQTNFVERTLAGVVSANIVGFTAGRVPLYQVVTSATAITSITEKRGTGLDAITGLGSNGLIARTAADTTAARTLTGTANQVTVTNGDGVGGNPTISLPNPLTLPTLGAILDLGSTGQIQFPATQNASAGANVLDDYEEGTFTPSLGGSTTYLAQAGFYTKVGRKVFVNGTITVNAIGTGGQQLSGMPFASASTTNNYSVFSILCDSMNLATVNEYAQLQPNTSTLDLFRKTASATAVSVRASSDYTVGSLIAFSGNYHAF
jgi:hypothetical protein